jgi:assimilatory nitrate reductase catalytic subunit
MLSKLTPTPQATVSSSESAINSTHALESSTALTESTCPYCGVGCGIEVAVSKQQDASTSTLKGLSTHPANYGRLCVKGTHLLETCVPEGRLIAPYVNGETVSWDTASTAVAQKLTQCIEQYGPNSVAFYVSGQLLTEDYYVANKLMKGFIGSANIDTNSRLCMSSAVAGYKRAFGADAVPCSYEDLEQTELLVLIGSNAAWTHPVLFQRMEQAKKSNPAMKVVVIDPRQTASASLADITLAIKSGSDTVLFNGLLKYLHDFGGLDSDFIEQHTDFADAAFTAASSFDSNTVSQLCDVDHKDLLAFYALFAKAKSSVSFYSMGINQSASGVDNANAIINCHLASGKIGKPGSGPFSITGQPNAMGGREVGGLANMLAAHMDIENPAHNALVERFWSAPNMAKDKGLKAVDMFEKVHTGDIKFIWIMATNPVVSMPNRQKIEAALLACETVVVSDTINKNDTLAFATIALPATGWSEKDGTVTNSERRISRQRALFPPHEQARHDWQIICDVAAKMGFADAFDYISARDIFCEHAKLSAYENRGSRDFDLSGLSELTLQQYDSLKPIQWPVNAANPNGTARMFSNNRFFTKNGKAKFIAITPKLAEQQTSPQFPYVLNTGRMRDQWHTMTRTGNAARLHQHTTQAELTIHPQDAIKCGFRNGDLVSIVSKHTAKPVIMPVIESKAQRKGELFAPIHWSKTWSSHVHLTSLFSDANDPISGQPELKHAAVNVHKTAVLAHGTITSHIELATNSLNEICDYWVKIKLENGYQYRIALLQTSRDANAADPQGDSALSLEQWFSGISASCLPASELYTVVSNGHLMALKTDNDKFMMTVALTSEINRESTDMEANWQNMLLGKAQLSILDIRHILRNQADDEFTQGKLICSCFSVREKTIIKTISEGCNSVNELGEKLKCGTNCGSCKSELAGLIAHQKPRANELIQVSVIEAAK